MQFAPRHRASALAVAVATATFGLTSSAHAINPLAPIWTGAYVGFHVGGNWSDVETDLATRDFSDTAFNYGGHAGFNLGLGAFVVGIEGDANLDNVTYGFTSAGGGASTLSTDWSGSIRGRLGVPIGPALLYATAGYTWTDVNFTEKPGGGGSFSGSHTFNGVVYGVGAEAFVFPNLSLRLEALRFDYGSEKLSITGASNAVTEFDPSDTVVRAGLTFHLN